MKSNRHFFPRKMQTHLKKHQKDFLNMDRKFFLSPSYIILSWFYYSFQTLLLGPSDAQEQVAVAPDSTAQLTISGCQQLEILTKTFNSIASIQNVTLRDMEKMILHSRLYESRVGNGDSMTINNFDVENVSRKKYI